MKTAYNQYRRTKMSSQYWDRVDEIFHAALKQEADQRIAFVQRLCGENQSLFEEVSSLLAAHEKADNFIDTPAIQTFLDDFSEAEEHLPIRSLIGSYRISKEIARGGMGTVYLAERADEQYQKHVAIKVIKRGMDTDSMLRHFRKERQILADFDHPNIGRFLDGGSTETGLPYFVMEYVEGLPIDQYCDEHRLSVTERLELFLKVCSAVSYAHRNLVIHRDIKPSNIVVTKEGQPKLLDFGIAKILQADSSKETVVTGMGIRLMTPEYASPEQAQGLQVTTLTDVYSLGVLLYELVTGVIPYEFKNQSPHEMVRVITERDPQLPSMIIDRIESQDRERVSKSREGTPDRLRRRLHGDLDNILMMAMRKEPQRRYQSVDHFAEDIKRHLSGLPVIATQDTFFYRSAKFVRRNKVLVAASSVAVVVIAFLIGFAWEIQRKADRQAIALQEFGQEVARVEGIIRFAHLQPLHDTRLEIQMVEERLRLVQKKMDQLGDAASGPGHYALGRGYMALDQYAKAKEHLDRAWTEYQYQEPNVAYALGLTMAMIYGNELQEAERISVKEQRESRLRQIEKEYRDPALSFIEQGRRTTEAPEYIEALILFLGKKYKESITMAQIAFKKVPWLYEAKKLEADVHGARAAELLRTGDLRRAREFFEKAEAAYRTGLQKGASDSNMHEGLCQLKIQIANMQFSYSDVSPEIPYLESIEACGNALKANPKNAEAYLNLATAHRMWSMYLKNHSQEAKPVLDKAIDAAKAAAELEPANFRAQKALGNAYILSVGSRENALKFHELAEDSFKKAIALNSKDADTHYDIASNYRSKAHYLLEAGKDPRPALLDAIKFIRKAIELDPNHYYARYEFGLIYDRLGYYEMTIGKDPRSSFDHAIEQFNEMVKRNPKDTYALIGTGFSCWRKSEFLVEQRQDPSPVIHKGRLVLEKVIQENVSFPQLFVALAETEIVAARWNIIQGKSPKQFLEKARNAVKRALAISSRSYGAHESMASTFRWEAEWLQASGKTAMKEIQQGITMVNRAIEVEPRSFEAHAIKGTLLLLQAHSAASSDLRKHAALQSLAEFKEAIQINSHAAHRYAIYQEEARMIADGNVRKSESVLKQ